MRKNYLLIYRVIAGIINMATENKELGYLNEINRFQLLPENDNISDTMLDSVGSGGRI